MVSQYRVVICWNLNLYYVAAKSRALVTEVGIPILIDLMAASKVNQILEFE